MDDATLVEAARSGDQAAWAAIYDRYADRLHDHCHRILRDRDEAADALHDAFIAASVHLDQLRDPSRLRPWLYSICRHEALRRARGRSRVELSDSVGEVTPVEVDMDRSARNGELQELVWSAAAGLSLRDQALLDLSVRQGLEGQDLADAMGTSLDSSYVMLSRMRAQVERSLGALLIARLGRDDCEELGSLLAGWDGRFTPLLRKRVARHVDGCDVCRDRRAALVSPSALLAATPLVPAPDGLRSRVLDGIDRGAGARPVRFTRGGFAAGERPRGRAPWLVAAAALVAVILGTALAVTGDDDVTPLAALGPSSSTTTTSTVETTSSTTTTTILDTTTTTSVAISPPPATTPDAPPPTQDPVVVPPPDTTPPAITSLTSQFPEIWDTCSTLTPKQSTISTTITGATAVVLRWSGAPLSGSKAMTAAGSTWTAVLGPFDDRPADLMLSYTVEARDTAGNVASRTATLMVAGTC